MFRMLIVMALLAVAPLARAAEPAALTAARRDLAAAAARADAAGVMQARGAFAALLADQPGSPELQWWIAFCGWRAIPLLTESNPEAAKKLCKESIAACDRAIAARPKYADAIALKAAVQALSLTFYPQAAMSLGPEMGEAYARAETMEPANPRVQLFKGIHTLHMPEYVGGGAGKAAPVLARAVELSAAAPAAGLPALRADALLWSGVCASRAGDWKTAAARFRDALALEPGNAWVAKRLLPEAEQRLAGGAPADSARTR